MKLSKPIQFSSYLFSLRSLQLHEHYLHHGNFSYKIRVAFILNLFVSNSHKDELTIYLIVRNDQILKSFKILKGNSNNYVLAKGYPFLWSINQSKKQKNLRYFCQTNFRLTSLCRNGHILKSLKILK